VKTVVTTGALFAFWLALTASLRPLDLAIGLALSVLLGLWAPRFLWADDAPLLSARQAGRFVLYIPRLLAAIVVAAVQVAEIVLEPHMPIEPVLIRYHARFERDVSRVAFANSITLTPGTLTVDVEDDTFVIHCIAERFADDITDGGLERTITQVFEE